MQVLALPAGSTIIRLSRYIQASRCKERSVESQQRHWHGSMSFRVWCPLMHCRVLLVMALAPCLISSDQCYFWSTHSVLVWFVLQGPLLSYGVLNLKPILHSVRK